MKTRHLLPELMDDPHLDRDEHFQALRGLQRINWCTQHCRLIWPALREVAVHQNHSSLRVLDVATGGGDLPIQLCRMAHTNGLDLYIDACDISSQALEYAGRNCDRTGVTLRLNELDVLEDAIPDEYDVILCSQFLHHLVDDQAESVLRKMAAAARYRVVVVDLLRSRVNWCQVWLATRVLSRSRIVHFDGPQSIRASFTLDEMRRIVDRVGFARFTLRPHWPCRFVLIGDVER